MDGTTFGVVANEADGVVFPFCGDADGPVVDQVSHHVRREIREVGETPGVCFDGVTYLHARLSVSHANKRCVGQYHPMVDGKMNTVIPSGG